MKEESGATLRGGGPSLRVSGKRKWRGESYLFRSSLLLSSRPALFATSHQSPTIFISSPWTSDIFPASSPHETLRGRWAQGGLGGERRSHGPALTPCSHPLPLPKKGPR